MHRAKIFGQIASLVPLAAGVHQFVYKKSVIHLKTNKFAKQQ